MHDLNIKKEIANKYKILLALHCTNDYFGFAYREIGNINSKEKFFIKKFDRDLSNHLIADLAKFLDKKNFNSIERISISLGPANFNASRLIVTCARTIAQQLKCSIDHFSSFKIMAKRLAQNNKITDKDKSFWIIKRLKNRGYIAGKYLIDFDSDKGLINDINEIIRPKLVKNLTRKLNYYEVDYDIKEDLKELLELSYKNHKNCIFVSWKNALPIYPISAIN